MNPINRTARNPNAHGNSRPASYGNQGGYNSNSRWQESTGSQSPPDNSSIINQFKQCRKKADDVLKVTVSCITKAINQRNPMHALTLLKNVKNAKITPDTTTYNAAISACGKAGGIPGAKNALKLLQEMKESGIKPDTITYSSAISACEKAGAYLVQKMPLNFYKK